MIKKKKSLLVFGCVMAVLCNCAFVPIVNAATTDVALKKFEAYGLHQCMENRFKSEFSADEVKKSELTVDLIKDGVKKVGMGTGESDTNYVVLPAGNGLSNVENDMISCVHLMWNLLGASDNEGGAKPFSGLLEKLGYDKIESGGSGPKCVTFRFKYYNEGVTETKDLGLYKYCESAVTKDGKIAEGSEPIFEGPENTYVGAIDHDNNKLCYYYGRPGLARKDIDDSKRQAECVDRSNSWQDVVAKLNNSIKKMFSDYDPNEDNDFIFDESIGDRITYGDYEQAEASEGVDGVYPYKQDKNSYKKAIANFLGEDYVDYKIDDPQTAGLYQGYILSFWGAETKACAGTREESTSAASDLVVHKGGNDYNGEYVQTKIYDKDGKPQFCYVRTDRYSDKVYGVVNKSPSKEQMSFHDVAKWLLDYGPETIDPTNLVTAKDSSEKSEESGEDTCRNSKGAESFGWIVCPLMSWLGKQAEDFYNDTVEPSLAVEPELFNAGGNGDMGSVRQAWESFRDLANIAFIILLLIVIFSQVTGVGIDNYGIKKILPKLIVAAVLINLSYLICLILIDLSNILGNGLQEFFNGLSKALGNNGEVVLMAVDDMKFAGGATEATIGSKVAGIGVLGALVGVTGLAVWANPAIVLSLLIGAVGVAVSMFFLFILLAARKALIVILVAISPLAFVCYMLPNTKSLFDKWKKLFEGMLLVYPIAGLLVGAGDYVSRILLKGSGGFFSWITAMVVGVMPVFFLPMVIKGAFSAMGKVGGMLTGMGAGASKATQKQIMGRGGEIAKKVGSTDTFRGIRNTVGMKSPISTKRMRARAVQDQAALMKERSALERLSDRGNIDTRLASIASAEEAKAVDEATSQRLSLMQSSGSEGGIRLGRGIKDATEEAVPFTLSNAAKRMEELEIKSRTEGLSGAEQQEVAALARGMVGMKGGAGALGNIIRGSGGVVKDRGGNVVSQGLNTSFMNTMGEIYARDSAVQSKLNEKDAGASAFTEQFMPGGNGSSFVPEQREMFASGFSGYQKTEEYGKAVNKRLKTYEAGLNQSGTAVDEYIKSLRKDDMQRIMNDDNLLNSLDRDVRSNVEEHAATLGVTKAPQNVRFIGSDPYGATTSRVTESGTGGLDSAGGLGGASGAGSAGRDGGSTQLDVRRAPELKVTNLESEFTRLGQTGGRNHG